MKLYENMLSANTGSEDPKFQTPKGPGAYN